MQIQGKQTHKLVYSNFLVIIPYVVETQIHLNQYIQIHTRAHVIRKCTLDGIIPTHNKYKQMHTLANTFLAKTR